MSWFARSVVALLRRALVVDATTSDQSPSIDNEDLRNSNSDNDSHGNTTTDTSNPNNPNYGGFYSFYEPPRSKTEQEKSLAVSNLQETDRPMGGSEGTTMSVQETVADRHDPLFASLDHETTLFARYKHTGEWFLGRVRTYDVDGTFTVCWEDGTIQIGTNPSDLRRMTLSLQRNVEKHLKRATVAKTTPFASSSSPNSHNESLEPEASSSLSPPPELNGMTVWEAAKKGDMETCLALVDSGLATPNQREIVGHGSSGSGGGGANDEGRTPLYWACLVGHAELVRELLVRGGRDADGSAYLAVTSRAKADDNRDLLFDPDNNTFSDWVDYPQEQEKETTTKSPMHQHTNQEEDDTLLIRAMLVAAKTASKRTNNSKDRMRRVLPQRLYPSTAATTTSAAVETCTTSQSDNNNNNNDNNVMPKNGGGGGECTVCLDKPANAVAIPCGHVSCCNTCLKKCQKRRDGCPICRQPIAAIVLK